MTKIVTTCGGILSIIHQLRSTLVLQGSLQAQQLGSGREMTVKLGQPYRCNSDRQESKNRKLNDNCAPSCCVLDRYNNRVFHQSHPHELKKECRKYLIKSTTSSTMCVGFYQDQIMDKQTKKRIDDYLKTHGGVIRTSDFQKAGFHNTYLSELTK